MRIWGDFRRKEKGIRRDIEGSRDLLLVVDVDFREGDFVGPAELRGELFVHWSDGFAGAAPVCVDYWILVSGKTMVRALVRAQCVDSGVLRGNEERTVYDYDAGGRDNLTKLSWRVDMHYARHVGGFVQDM